MSGSRPGTASSARGSEPALAVEAWCDDDFIFIRTADGRVLDRELPGFLGVLTPQQRRNCHVDEFGIEIYWPDIDETLGVDWLFVPEEVMFELAGFEKGPFPDDLTEA